MYFWNSYPFVRLVIVLIAGTIGHDSYPSIWNSFPSLNLFVLAFSIVTLLVSKRIGFYKLRHVNGILFLLLFFLLGGELAHRQYHVKSNDHYSKISRRVRGFAGQVMSTANERTNHHRYDFSLHEVLFEDSIIPSEGVIHLYVRKDSTNKILSYGDFITAKGSFFQVSGPGNPSEFDYRKYLSRQNIFSHAFIRGSDLEIIYSKPSNPIFEYAYRFQFKALEIIDRNIPQSRENGIAKALLLGIKDHLDNDVKRSYSAAGAMHVLAVSGLHVGVIYLFLQYLLGRLRATSSGRKIFGILSIGVIWTYAIVTGLSPSVLRAATMFSIMAIGDIRSRKGNIYNTLGLAAFILLLFDPYLIYSVGFQLSFAAVFGIVYLQPKIYHLFNFNSWLIDKAWAITAVSIAAQVATFPISAFYFHQFPTYFLISNLVVIPAATVMLFGGILMLIVDVLSQALGLFVGNLLSKFIWGVNECIAMVEAMPNSLLDWIYMDQQGLVMIYSVILTLFWGLHHRSFNTLIISALILIYLTSAQLKSLWFQSSREFITLYELNETSAIDYIKGHQATLFVDTIQNDDLELLSFQINPNRLALSLKPVSQTIREISNSKEFESGPFYISGILGDTRILILDSVTFHLTFKKPIVTDLLIIENESVKSLTWLNKKFQYNHLILGNKNSTFFINKIKKQAQSLNQRVHSLHQDGAFVHVLEQ